MFQGPDKRKVKKSDWVLESLTHGFNARVIVSPYVDVSGVSIDTRNIRDYHLCRVRLKDCRMYHLQTHEAMGILIVPNVKPIQAYTALCDLF